MQTGQNSIAPEKSLPQLGQVRWGSVLMGLTVLEPHSEPKATPRSTDWCEIGQYGPLHTVNPFHEELPVRLYWLVKSRFGTKFQPLVLRVSPVFILFGWLLGPIGVPAARQPWRSLPFG
jgi:hypothetical protein